MFFVRHPPVVPIRDFPLVLRQEWRSDRPNPRLGRLRALAYVATRERTARPKPWGFGNDARR